MDDRLHEALHPVLATYVAALRQTLGDEIVGVYVTGSAVGGDFEPKGSDVDLLVLLQSAPNESDLGRLREVHRALNGLAYGDRLEVEYVGRDQLRPDGIRGQSISISPGDDLSLGPSNAAADDMLGARTLGLALIGPSPEAVFPVVDRSTFVASQEAWLLDLAQRDRTHAHAQRTDYAEWILNIARCLFGIEHGEGCNKRRAATWLSQREPDLRVTLEKALDIRRGSADRTIEPREFRTFADKALGVRLTQVRN